MPSNQFTDEEVWLRFAMAVVPIARHACEVGNTADQLLASYRRRFPKPNQEEPEKDKETNTGKKK